MLEEAPKGNGLYIYKELTKLCLVTGPLASLSRECSRQTVEHKLISLKKKELTKLYLVTGPLASISRECSRLMVELKLISFKKKRISLIS